MRKGFVCLFVALLLMQAQVALADMSWYLGAGGGFTRLRTANFNTFSGLSPPPVQTDTVVSGDFVEVPFGWQIYGGAMFTENFGLLLKYSDSGKGKDTWGAWTEINAPGNPPSVLPGTTTYSFAGEMQMDGYTIYLTQVIPMGDKFEYGIEIGWTQQDIEFNWDSTSVSTIAPPPTNSGRFKRDDTGFAFGALMRYKFVEHFAVSTEFEWLLVDFGDMIDRPIKLNVNLEYHF